MKKLLFIPLMFLFVVNGVALGQSLITCTPNEGKLEMWPEIYISKKKRLCFDVAGWRGYKGNNCVDNGGNARWSAYVFVTKNGENAGRTDTLFKVENVIFTDTRIEYQVWWRRHEDWVLQQSIEIDRLTGRGVDWFVDEQGGQSISCSVKNPKI